MKTKYNKARWIENKIAENHAARANNPVMQAKIDAQAYELLRERVAIFGAEWHENCAVRLPADVEAVVARLGTDALLIEDLSW